MNRHNLQLSILCLVLLKTGHPIPSSMKAIVMNGVGGTYVLEIREGPLPNITDKQVLVHVKAAGINPVDAHIRSGKYPLNRNLPPILGKEIAGIVAAVHPNVTKFKVGDRVFCYIEMGGYAEYAVSLEGDCYPLSERLTFSQGAALYITYLTACRALQRAHIQKNETILIHGTSGSLGTATIQLAKAMGAIVVASVGSPTLERLAKNAGCHHVIYHDDKRTRNGRLDRNRTALSDSLMAIDNVKKSYTESRAKNHLKEAIGKLGIRGFNVIMEILANVDIKKDEQFLAENGRIIILGNRALLAINRSDEPSKNTSVFTVGLFNYLKDEQEEAAKYVLECIDKNLVTPLVGQEYRFDQAPRAHYDIIRYKAARGKLVFII